MWMESVVASASGGLVVKAVSAPTQKGAIERATRHVAAPIDSGDVEYRFGVVGAGVIGAFHAAAIALVPDARLVAVTDVDPGRAEAFAGRHGCVGGACAADCVRQRGQPDDGSSGGAGSRDAVRPW